MKKTLGGAFALFVGAVVRRRHVDVVQKDEQLMTLSDQMGGEGEGVVFQRRIVEQAIEFGLDPSTRTRKPCSLSFIRRSRSANARLSSVLTPSSHSLDASGRGVF